MTCLDKVSPSPFAQIHNLQVGQVHRRWCRHTAGQHQCLAVLHPQLETLPVLIVALVLW
jgi:hypothetical protein